MSESQARYAVEPGTVLDVGAGENPDERADYTADKHPLPGTDFSFDITDSWPFTNNRFEGVIARHVFEHVGHDTLREHVFPEAARVLEAGGWLEIRVPLGCDAVADPTHKSRWAWRTPLFYADNHRHWTGVTGFELLNREMTVWFITPLEYGTPFIRWAARRWPMEFWYEIPGATGELICEYKRLP